MDEERLFSFLKTQDKAQLIDWLRNCFDHMTVEARQTVFWEEYQKLAPQPVEGSELLQEVMTFDKETRSGVYYREIVTTYKNYDEVPPETDYWWDRLGLLLEKSVRLTEQHDESEALACFRILAKLYEDITENGEELIFDHEQNGRYGIIDENTWRSAYIKALTQCCEPSEYGAATVKAANYSKAAINNARQIANPQQKEALEEYLRRIGRH